MPRDHDPLSTPDRLPDDLARRVLARAAELDSRQGTEVPLAQLREIAAEAGIDAGALDRALAEFHLATSASAPPATAQVREAGLLARLWRRVTGRGPAAAAAPATGGLKAAVAANVLAFAAFWVLINAGNGAASALGLGWEGRDAIAILAHALGITLAWRLRGRVTTLVLGVAGVALAAEYAVNLWFGAQRVHGLPEQFALLAAALVGIGFGALFVRSRDRSGETPAAEPVTDTATTSQPARAAAGPRGHPPQALMRHA